jgi:murein DD-endopeptidase MepM/ murein hydrolase activator NlpD
LDQGRLRAANRRLVTEPVDLGHEPPLSVDGGNGLVDRRRLSVQWFCGTILTGLCGAALMGGAVFASLDGETNFATAPERVGTVLRGALSSLGSRLTGLRKTDRLSAQNEAKVEREVLRVPNVTHSRDREMVRVRPYERVFGNLSLTVSDPDLAAKIPPFNPQKILADAVAGDDQTAAPQPDAEVSFSTCDFAPAAPRAKITPAVCELGTLLPKVKRATLLPLDDVLQRVRDTAESGGGTLLATGSLGPGGATPLRLGYAADEPDPYLGFQARIVPENVTLLPKTVAGADDGDRVVTAKKGDTVASILQDLGAPAERIAQIVAALGAPTADSGLKEGEKVHVLLAPNGLGRLLPLRVMIADDSGILAAAALSDMGAYVPVDLRNVDADAAEPGAAKEVDSGGPGASLYQSLWDTALQNNVPPAVIDQMVRIYAYDVDFQRKVQPGDSFDVLYAEDGNGDGAKEVRYAALTVGGETKKYYHFRTTDDGMYDYYDDSGKSAKKFLVRKPVAVGIETSPFGYRNHPLLHIKEFHSGVDWAAPVGTPIFAAGNGTIEEIGPKGGYGKYVRIRHADGYETAYGHMTAFARGLDVGSRVRQGQVIGFVGSTGLSTGSHVHFEIHINDRFVDPMTVKLPRGRVLDSSSLAQFERDRRQLDTLMANATVSHVAQAR